MRTRILLFLTSLILVPSLTYLVILFARGYRPDFTKQSLQPTGIMAATSLPEGAEIYIDGVLKAATDTNFNLNPGTYAVEIKKDTYTDWKKTLEIKAEEVTRATAILFPRVPSLKAVTTAGADRPLISPDGTKVIFLQDQNLYLLDLNESPLGLLNRDSKLLYALGSSLYDLTWSPDSRQVLAVATPSALLVDVNNPNQTRDATINYQVTLQNWKFTTAQRENQKLDSLPKIMQEILTSSAASLAWSPRENKLLYTATASAVIPDELIRPLPGSSTQVQDRIIEPGNTYVYDLEEDRNFKIENCKLKIVNLRWFPTSNHLICLDKNKVTILEYDGQNPIIVYQGPMENGYAFAYPSSKQLLILTNLSPETSKVPNLYALNLR